MIGNFLWIFLLILQCGIVTPAPAQSHRAREAPERYSYDALNKPAHSDEEQVISVRITSSVAVGRTDEKAPHYTANNHEAQPLVRTTTTTDTSDITTKNYVETVMTEIPPNLLGANIEYIKQLSAKKEARSHTYTEQVHPFQLNIHSPIFNKSHNPVESFSKNSMKLEDELQLSINGDDSVAEPSTMLGIEDKILNYENLENVPLAFSRLSSRSQVNKIEERVFNLSQTVDKSLEQSRHNSTDDSVAASSFQYLSTLPNKNEEDENLENIPLARSLPFSPSSKNYIQGLNHKPSSERGNNPSLTTVSFNIVHDTPKPFTDYTQQNTNSNQGFNGVNKLFEPPKIYSQPAQIYSEPAKIYSEPAKIYSEPAKIYSEPAKVYSEPAKIYSEPAKFYSQPASLHLTPEVIPNYSPWQDPTKPAAVTTTATASTTTATTLLTTPSEPDGKQLQPERNYEIDEKLSVLTDGRSHGVQETSTEKCLQENCKVGYVVEGRQFKKYRVEERTSDGFIVGEYGVVRNEDGALRGVRYTADGDASPRLIYDALMKFLQLK